ncbi:MAG: SBBP repeat-containing protein [Bacteroidetes bacterium]|nr:SBBP repeat-containing protein [Bacteroidota bacterium]
MALLVKVPAQIYQWADRVGNAQNSETFAGLVSDEVGNTISVGTFRNTVDFDPGPGVFNLTPTSNNYQTYILKLDAAGNFVWAKGLFSSGRIKPHSVATDPNGNIFVGGTFVGVADFDPGPGTYTQATTGWVISYVLKLDPNGNFLWAKMIDGSQDDDFSRAMTVDGAGSVYTTGRQANSTDYDPGSGTSILYGANNVFIVKLSSAGTFLWVKGLGTTGVKDIFGIKADANGTFCITGSYDTTFDTDPGPGTNMITGSGGGTDAFIIKFDASGNHLWGRGIGAAGGNDGGLAVTFDPNGSALVTGYFATNLIDFDPGVGTAYESTIGGEDIFVLKLNDIGSYEWHAVMGGAGTDRGIAIDTDPLGNVFTTGQFSSTVDFDPGATTQLWTSAGSQDAFVQILDSMGLYKDSYRWGGTGSDICYAVAVPTYTSIFTGGIFTNTVDFDPGAGVANLTSTGGSDIFVSKIDQCVTTTATINPTFCNTYTAPDGQVYTMSGTYTAIIPNSQVCDSVITINLTVNFVPFLTGFISGNSAICAGSSNTYTFPAAPSATSYNWTLPSGWSGSSTTNTISTTATATGGIITVNGENNCGVSTDRTLNVAIIPIPAQPGSITGNIAVCPGSTNTYSIASVPGATSYAWTLPGGWSGSSSSNSLTASAGASGGNLTVIASNACGSSSAQSLPISIMAAPAQPGAISGNLSVCAGSENTYSITPVPGATSYTWSLPGGWSGSSTTTSMTATAGTQGGTVSVTADDASCHSIPQTITANISPGPATAFSASTNSLVTSFTDLSAAATAWAWDFGDWSTSTAQNPTHTYFLPFVYNVCLTATAANGCTERVCQYVPVNTVLGILDPTILNVSVYPNPSTGLFRIVTDRKMEGHVFDAQGKLVMISTYPAGESLLDLSGYAEGIYFVRLTKGVSEANFRLSKVGE